MPPKLQALLATARIANVPSVICNVLTGWVIGGLLGLVNYEKAGVASPIWLPILSGCCLYVAGNFLNDWYDYDWDRKHRPERAIPAGIFSRGTYLAIALILWNAGLACSLLSNMTMAAVYAVITIFVISYTVFHKQYSASIWLMGACRAGLYFMGIATFSTVLHYESFHADQESLLVYGLLSLPVIGMLCYIAGISLLARYEASGMVQGGAKLIASLLLLSPIMTHACPWITTSFISSEYNMLFMLGLVPFAAWTLIAIFRKISVSQKVSHLLAGIPLVDSVFVWCGCLYFWRMISYNNSTQAIFLLYPLGALLAALLLQKIAPAT